jgi:TonB-dependent receptor
VTYIGYNTVKETFEVAAGQTAVREITLTSAAETAGKDGIVQLSAFTVASQREGNAKAIQAQRRDMNIITSVSSDIFGDVADGNIGEFLKYLPGIDLDYVESEPRGPRLGGMDGQYVGVAFDGMRTASADANRAAAPRRARPASKGSPSPALSLSRVNLTNSPENDADTPAGNVNMRTKRAFDRKGRQFSYNLSGNFNSEETWWRKSDGPRDKQDHKWKPNYIFSYAESFFDQKFGLLLSANHSWSYTEQIADTMNYGVATTDPVRPRPLALRSIDFGDGPKNIQKDAMLLTADWRVTPKLVVSLNMVYSYYEGEFWNRTFSFVAANDNNNVNNGRPSIGGDAMTTIIAERNATANSAALNNGGGGAAKLVYTRQYAPRFEYKSGGLIVDGAIAFSKSKNNYESLERGFSKDEGGSIPSGFIATRPNAQSWEWTIRQTSGPDWFDLKNFTGGTRVTNDDRTWITEKWTGTLNSKYILPFMERFPTAVKVGGKWDEETRRNRDWGAWSIWSYNGPGGNTVAYNPATETYSVVTQGSWANLGPAFISPNPLEFGKTNAWNGGGVYNINGQLGRPPRPSRNAMSDLYHAHPEQFVNIATVDNWYTSFVANDKNIRQTITSGYVQADTRFTHKLTVRYGVRMEETENAIKEWDPLTRAQMLKSPYAAQFASPTVSRATSISGVQYQYMSQPKTTRRSKYHQLFPAISFKYNIVPNLEWQAGFNKSIGRPNLDAIAGLWVVDEQNFRVTAPAPFLLPEHHKKYLTRLAYYFQGRSPGSFAVTFSKTDFTNTLTAFDYTSAEFGNTDPDYENFTFRAQRNISDRITTTKNMSISYRQTLGFLPTEYLRNTTVFVNYDRTYITQSGDGSGPAARRAGGQNGGISPRRLASGISYRFRKFSGSLNMIYGDNRPESGTYGQYYGALTKFDGSLGYAFKRYLEFFMQVRNITNVKDGYYRSPPGVIEGEHAVLRKMEEYGTNWIFGIKGLF